MPISLQEKSHGKDGAHDGVRFCYQHMLCRLNFFELVCLSAEHDKNSTRANYTTDPELWIVHDAPRKSQPRSSSSDPGLVPPHSFMLLKPVYPADIILCSPSNICSFRNLVSMIIYISTLVRGANWEQIQKNPPLNHQTCYKMANGLFQYSNSGPKSKIWTEGDKNCRKKHPKFSIGWNTRMASCHLQFDMQYTMVCVSAWLEPSRSPSQDSRLLHGWDVQSRLDETCNQDYAHPHALFRGWDCTAKDVLQLMFANHEPPVRV